ncbi:MAG: ATP-binding protein [Chloroflexota bacterium]|nr:ATP-binding protein [Chloroflexota bacterium]
MKSALERFAQKWQSANASPALNATLADPNTPIQPRDGEAPCSYCGNMRFLLDGAGKLVPCSHCAVVQKWQVRALDSFSSRQGTALTQTFFNFKATFKGKTNDLLATCLEAAEDFAHDPHEKWLIFWGDRGNGKSHLCAAVANHLVSVGTPVLFLTMPDLLAALKQTLDLQANTEQESYSGRMRSFKTAPVLILDDLGAESGSAWADGVMFEILDYRYRNRLPTMIATNVALDEFDPRVASRMQDKALATVIKNSAPDFRKRALSER